MRLVLPLVVVVGAGAGYLYWRNQQNAEMRQGFAQANGRIELQRFDVAAKMPGRVATVLVREGDAVQAGSLIATLDHDQVADQIDAAVANVAAARQAEAQALAEVDARAVALRLAQIETGRANQLVGDEAVSTADVDSRRAQRDADLAALTGARAAASRAAAMQNAAAAQLAQIRSVVEDTRLIAPVAGRVEYRLVEPGAVVGAGSQIVTLLDPLDAYMTVFLPTRAIVRLRMGAAARLKLDSPDDIVLPAKVSFISSDAQFTPRTVETESERDKLMYRVKLAIDRRWLAAHLELVHGGLTGEAFVQLDDNAVWPADLQLDRHGQ